MRALLFTAVLVAAAPVAAQDARPDGSMGRVLAPEGPHASAPGARKGGPGAGEPFGGSVVLAVGARRILPDEGVASYSESGPGFFDIEIAAPGHLVLIGRRAGTKSLLLLFSDGTQRRYTITVTP